MNAHEFSNQFDVLYNNITSNQAPGLNEYEKSVFLTKAQDEIIKNYFNPKANKVQDGFDSTAKRQTDFSMLLATYELDIPNIWFNDTSLDRKVDPRAVNFDLPHDLFLAINESILDKSNTRIRQVIPLSFSEYTRLMSKPYKEPLKYQAWRLIANVSEFAGTTTSLILNSVDRARAKTEGVTYILRYVKTPIPIILENLEEAYGENLTINGYTGGEQEYENNCCELHPAIHEEILQRAVELAKVAWQGDPNLTIQAGQRSE